MLMLSVLCVAAGLGSVLVSVAVLAGWPWALLAVGVVLVYAGYVASTRVTR